MPDNKDKRKEPRYLISVVARMLDIHPQTLRLYEREGFVEPQRTKGNTRMYSEEDLERLEAILNLTRDMGVNLAGVEIILRMREKIENMQQDFKNFFQAFCQEMEREYEGFQKRATKAVVKSPLQGIVVLEKKQKKEGE